MCYVVHNHGTAIEVHSRLFLLQPNVAELGTLSAISVTAECCRTRRNVALFLHAHSVYRFTRCYHVKKKEEEETGEYKDRYVKFYLL